MSDAKPSAVDNGLFVEIQRFLFREAALLDRREYAGWLSLTTDDIQYRVTAAVARDAGAKAVDYAIIDEDKTGLKSRIDQISNPRLTRAENPPSMVRRVVSNIEAYSCRKAGRVFGGVLSARLSKPSKRARGRLLCRGKARHVAQKRHGLAAGQTQRPARSHLALRWRTEHIALNERCVSRS